jgi:putative ABC transport system permease protein
MATARNGAGGSAEFEGDASATPPRGIYRWLLLACPRDVRDSYGSEMEAVFRHCLAVERRRRGRLAMAAVWVRAATDAIRFALAARVDARRRRRWGRGGAASGQPPLFEGVTEMVRTILQDLRFGARLLVKDRSFTVAAGLTLAVCIGANTAIFSVVRSVIFEPLPVPDSSRIVLMYQSYPKAGADVGDSSVPDYFDRLKGMTVFSELALYRRGGMTLGEQDGARRLMAVRTTPSFFRLLEARPVQGRIFSEQEGELGHEHEAILSYGLWQQLYGGAPVVGRDIPLNGTSYAVVGVMPAEFKFLWNDVDVYVPAAFTAEDRSDASRHNNSWDMIGRLKPGATLAEVQQQLDAINAANDKRFPEFHQILKDAGFHSVAVFLQAFVVRQVRPVLYLLWGGVLFVLLIGCVNVASLVVVRSIGRTRELATRYAMGAGLTRLSRQLLTEIVLLSAAGGAVGLLAGWWVLHSATVLHFDNLPRGFEIRLDPTGAAVIFGATLVVGLAIGLVPVARLARLNLNGALREEGRGGTGGRGTTLLRRGLATAQVAIAFVLLVGAGLMLASFRAVLHLDPGFDPAGVVTATVSLPGATYADDASEVAFVNRMLPAVRALPGVQAAGVTDQLPFGDSRRDSVIVAEGYVMKPGESLISPLNSSVSDGYFEAMRIPLVRGRYFDERDTADSPRVIIVDQWLANKFWPGQDPLGHRMFKPDNAKDLVGAGPNRKFLTVVGVVRNVQTADPGSTDFTPVGAYYLPYSQAPSSGMVLAVKSQGNPDTLIREVRRQIATIDPGLPVYSVKTMSAWLDDGFIGRRVPMILAMSFGVVALFLAAVGIYGVLAYGVSQRRREIGIRMALGSTTREVFGLVLADGIRIIGAGLALGIAGGYFAGRAMTNQLYDVTPTDPYVFGAVIVVLSVVALAATVVPARRAARVNPTTALNQ